MTTDRPAPAMLTVGVILAGGLSRRMEGPEKSLLTLAGKPLIAHVLERLKPQVSRVVLNANDDPERFAELGLPVQPDTVPGNAGPLAGVLAGMRWTQENEPEIRFVASAATDTPFFPVDLVEMLAEATQLSEDTIGMAASGGHRHPVFGLWPVALTDDLEAFLNSGQGGKVMRFVERHRLVEVEFPLAGNEDDEAGDPFFNVNTPRELERAREFAAGLELRIAEGVARDA